MKKVIELKEVWKIYQVGEVEIKALRGLNLSVREGEFLAILGTSGSGKSTCVNHIGCLDTPTRGEILLDGQNIAHLHESTLANIRGKKIGFIFQSFNLIPSMSAFQNVMLPMIFQGVTKEKRINRSKELLTLVGLGDRMQNRPTQLSGGQQQRVAIARALANDPEVILADEPTGNLDSKTEKDIMDLLSNLHKKENKTIVMITHNEKLAKYAQRVVHLIDGRIGS
ncbi:ABC transporter ATP-binding protein [Candidatus Woesearchaeota archaeon]|nr:ABC transporter ATP-binding protein [Candidatus Woesearchaeota archaeon]